MRAGPNTKAATVHDLAPPHLVAAVGFLQVEGFPTYVETSKELSELSVYCCIVSVILLLCITSVSPIFFVYHCVLVVQVSS